MMTLQVFPERWPLMNRSTRTRSIADARVLEQAQLAMSLAAAAAISILAVFAGL